MTIATPPDRPESPMPAPASQGKKKTKQAKAKSSPQTYLELLQKWVKFWGVEINLDNVTKFGK